MSDRQIPMEPAELLTVGEPKTEMKDSYGTAVPRKAKKKHTGLIIAACFAVIFLATLLAGIRLAHKRLAISEGRLVLRPADELQMTEGPPEQELQPNADAAPERDLPAGEDFAHDSLQLGAPPQAPAEGVSIQELYAQTAPGVVCVCADSFGETVTGTGIVLDENGFVLTTEDVLRGAQQLRLVTNDGESVTAQLVGVDGDTGFALLHGELTEPHPVRFGKTVDLKVGAPVYCIGNPYGENMRNVLSEGVLTGIGSGKVRGAAISLLDADAFFEEDSVGYPLFDGAGNVIGVTALVGVRRTEEVCFAVGADDVQRIAQQIMTDAAAAANSWLGFEVEQIPDTYRYYFGFPGKLWISDVGERTYADGVLAVYDVILSVDGAEVSTVDEYRAALSRHEPGDRIELRIFRGGLYYKIILPLTER